jgi:hypothetical protein
VESGYVAGAGLGETKHAIKDAHGRWTVQGADIGLGFIEPLDVVSRHLPAQILRFKSELSKYVFHRNALAAPSRKPCLAIVKAVAAVTGSSSGGAVAMARATGSRINSKMRTTAPICDAGSRSMSSCACCLSHAASNTSPSTC